MKGYDTIVLGLGAMGSAAVHQLARRGQRVLGIDAFSTARPTSISPLFAWRDSVEPSAARRRIIGSDGPAAFHARPFSCPSRQ